MLAKRKVAPFGGEIDMYPLGQGLIVGCASTLAYYVLMINI
jgi:hypothetical protein